MQVAHVVGKSTLTGSARHLASIATTANKALVSETGLPHRHTTHFAYASCALWPRLAAIIYVMNQLQEPLYPSLGNRQISISAPVML